MAYSKHNPMTDLKYLADTVEDLKKIHGNMGDVCLVIENGKEYMANSKHEWVCPALVEYEQEQENTSIDLTDYVTTEQLAHYHYIPYNYEIKNCPVETSIDYRDKEIRIFCHEDAQWKKQQVGEGGNPNMYYMTFRAYAPQNAFYLKEGDKGVILDEIISLYDGSGTGIDKFGRRYKDHWFALAMYNEDSDSWTYFGANSNASKYLGWNYVVEWYDKNNKLIKTDAIRVNLSNKDCHNLLPHYYG